MQGSVLALRGSARYRALLCVLNEILQLARHILPFLGLFHGGLHLRYIRPDFRELGIQGQELLLIFWQFVFGVDCVDGALRLTQGAVDTLIGMDDQEIGAFIETVYWTYFHTVGVLTKNAVIAYNKCHDLSNVIARGFGVIQIG